MSISFVDCGPDRVSALRAFFSRVYGPTYVLAVNDNLLAWQFGPREDASARDSYGRAFKLALLDEDIVGCLGYIAADVSVGSTLQRGAWVVNWLVDPDQRHLGIGPLLMREVTRQFEVTLNLGPNESARTILVRMGWADLGPLPRYVHVLDRASAAHLTESGQLDWLVDVVTHSSSIPEGVVRVDEFREHATQLWRALRETSTTAGARRSAAFLNWRYAHHPMFQYRLFESRHDDALTGLAVYRVETVRDQPVRVGRLTELVCEPGSEDALLAAVSADARTLDVALLDFFCADRRMHDSMIRNGFVGGDALAAAGLPMLFQPVNRRSAGPVLLAHLGDRKASEFDWYVTTGDADQDRPN